MVKKPLKQNMRRRYNDLVCEQYNKILAKRKETVSCKHLAQLIEGASNHINT